MKVSPARRAAFEILRRVEQEDAYSSVLLAANEELDGKDRGLCHELVLGVLRRRLWLDRTLEHLAARRVDDLDLPVTLALRLGLYQLRFLTRIPPSAAVNESVNLVRAARLKSAASFVNAVLRRATRERDHDPTKEVADPIEKLAIETSHPRWLVDRWISQFGLEDAALIAGANNEPACLAFRFTAKALRDPNRRPADILEDLRKAGVELIESKIAAGAWRLVRADRDSVSAGTDAGEPHTRPPQRSRRPGDPGSMRALSSALLRGFSDEGLIYFQDEASQLVAYLLGAHARDRVLDVCAAPGSKSMLIAAQAPESIIVAGDLHEHRVRIIQESATKQDAGNVPLIVHDATRPLPFAEGVFDRVLIDAPCSGTGTLRHNPEIRWRLRAEDIANLATKQKLILRHAAAMVRPGGRLLYSTCSLEKDENEAVVTEFLEHHPDFQLSHFQTHSDLQTESGALRTWPHRQDVDGFFVMALQRNR